MINTTVAAIHWGKPSSLYRAWEITTVCCHGFADLPAERGKATKSPEFTCLDHRWYLEIYPGGDEDSADGSVAIFLWSVDPKKSINIDFGFTVKDGEGGVVENSVHGSNDGNVDIGLGGDFASRSKIVGALVEGTLVIEVRMRLAGSSPSSLKKPAFVPENPCKGILGGLFLDEKTADVVFEVGGPQRSNNDSNSATVSFPAHSLILERYSNKLADLCRSMSVGGDGATPSSIIRIDDVSPDVFRHLLRYLYGGEVFEEGDARSCARDIFEAADGYGMTELKLEAEAWYVDSKTLSMENVKELLLYADAKNCALLKERVMDFIVMNKVEVLDSVAMDDVPGGLFSDLLAAVVRVDGTPREGGETTASFVGGVDASFSVMGISELRQRAHESGLAVDGSREALIKALKYPCREQPASSMPAPVVGQSAPVVGQSAPVVGQSGTLDDNGGGGAGGGGGFLRRLLVGSTPMTAAGVGDGFVDVPRDDDGPSSPGASVSDKVGSPRDP
jgi:hypothetical protein